MEVIFAIIIDIYKLYVYLTIGFPNENWRRVNVLPRLRFSNELCYIAIYKISFPNGLSWYGENVNLGVFGVDYRFYSIYSIIGFTVGNFEIKRAFNLRIHYKLVFENKYIFCCDEYIL